MIDETGSDGVLDTLRAWAVSSSKVVVVPCEKEEGRWRRAMAQAEIKYADCTA